ncbi:MAG: hypothetical protein IOC66_25015 [Burkholderia sp.]|nr:hypothetical protein [Burkholderia sp.]
MVDLAKLREAVGRQPIDAELTLGAGGTIYDLQGRVICTVNIKDLPLPESWAYANLFHFAATNFTAILRAMEGRDG